MKSPMDMDAHAGRFQLHHTRICKYIVPLRQRTGLAKVVLLKNANHHHTERCKYCHRSVKVKKQRFLLLSAAFFHAQEVFVLLKDVYNFDIFYPGSITLQERKAEREYIACLFIRS